MEEQTFIIKKIPLKDFISILIELYDGGADFVDFTGKPEGEEDIIQLSVLQEYMSKEEDDDIKEEDLNNLIG